MLQRIGLSLAAVMVLLWAADAQAGIRHGCRACCAPCVTYAACGCGGADCGGCAPVEVAPVQPTYVERTVYVPEMVTEMRKVQVCEYKNEVRERRFTVYRQVPEIKKVTEEYTVMTTENRVRKESYVVAKPVYKEVPQNYTVMVPYQEKRTGTRTVCRTVQETRVRTVCEDQGHYEDRVYSKTIGGGCYSMSSGCNSGCNSACGGCHSHRRCRRSCGGCGGCGSSYSGCGDCVTYTPPTVCNYVQKVWVPNIVNREVPYVVNRMVPAQENFEYMVTLCRPEVRTRMIKVCEYVKEQHERDVPYTVCVPVKQSRTVDVTTYRSVPEEKVEKYTVAVPYTVEKEVPVTVCRMIEKKITVPVYPCGPSPCAQPCGKPCCK